MSVDSNKIDFDLLFQNDETRKILDQYLKNLNDSSDVLLKVYTILICSIQIRNDRQRTKQILEKTYNLVNKNQLSSFLNDDLCIKFCETLQKTTYNESVFNAVKKEIKQILENDYFPKFLKSKIFKSYMKLHNKNSKKNLSTDLSQFDDLIEKYDSEQNQIRSVGFSKPSVYTVNNQLSNNKVNKTFSSSSASSSSSINSLHQSSLIKKSIANIKSDSLARKENSFVNKSISNSTSTRSLSQPMPPNPYHVISSYQSQIPVSCQDSEIQSMVSGIGGYDSQLEDDTLTNTSQMNSTKINKANVSAISTSSTSKYSNKLKKQSIIANKNAQANLPHFDLLPPQPNPLMIPEHELESIKKQTNGHTDKRKVPPQISESDPRKFFDILSSKLENYIKESENNKLLKTKSYSNSNIIPTYNQSHPIDLDSQLDEHLDRVYNNHSINIKSSRSPDKISLINQFNNKLKFSDYKNNIVIDPQSKNKMNNNSFFSLKTANKSRHNNSMNHSHHFYQLTNTCKEVDIDSQNVAKSISKDHDSGCSGVSLRSASSIERVNDWLANTSINETNNNRQKNTKLTNNPNISDGKTSINEKNVKTPVAYYMPGEDVAYMSTFNSSSITLNQFKQLITKKGAFRYFFKTKCNLLDDEECIVFQEATDDNAYVPMFNNKVIAKIEKISN
jgi:hypothetical protein